MGAGIAQVAAAAGWDVLLSDSGESAASLAIDSITSRFDRNVTKGKMSAAERDAAVAHLKVDTTNGDIAHADLLIEAIVEDMDVKADVLSAMCEKVSPDCILATNTSSLSVTALGARIDQSHRVVGMHFFNPAPLMKLVEIVSGERTLATVVNQVDAIAQSWGKVTARAADVPGFIVNHVARPYYLEAFRLVEDGVASPDHVDRVMTEVCGFRMGPFQLTDLIGQDVNAATTRSVWEQLGRPPLLEPSPLQESLVTQGNLGRKTGRGVYVYDEANPSENMLSVNTPIHPVSLHGTDADALQQFATRASQTSATFDSIDALILSRVLLALMVQAHLACERGVASSKDIDVAMKYGVNYPRGPFEWAAHIGADLCIAACHTLEQVTQSDRFTPPHSLLHME